MKIDLIFAPFTANKQKFRSLLREALSARGKLPCWQEWQSGDAAGLPRHLIGSPAGSLFVNGTLVWKAPFLNALPQLSELVKLLKKAEGSAQRKGWKLSASLVGKVALGLGIALFPKCPMCWAAYMSAFGALGLEKIPYQPWLLPLMFILLGVNLFFLYRRAQKRRNRGPLWLSLAGFSMLFVGKFLLGSEAWMFVGISGIVLGSLWNALPERMLQSAAFWLRRPFSRT